MTNSLVDTNIGGLFNIKAILVESEYNGMTGVWTCFLQDYSSALWLLCHGDPPPQ